MLLAALVSACGGGGTGSTAPTDPPTQALLVAPQNSDLTVGINRVGIALLDGRQQPILNAQATLRIQGGAGTFETRPLEWIGPNYGAIPVYLGTARFDQPGQYRYVVHAVLAGGHSLDGSATVSVVDPSKSAELPVRARVTAVGALTQRTLHDPATTLAELDSGVPPDQWHDATIADGLARHQPMLLYFGEPGRCPSQTCGPTVKVLQTLWPQYQGRVLFEHIEVHIPASSETFNPVYIAFGLTSEPWVYLVNADGIVTDRFEGPVTADEIRASLDGTLAGQVPAVQVTLG